MGREDQGRAILVSGSRSVNRIVDRRRLIAMSQRKRRGRKGAETQNKRTTSPLVASFSRQLCVLAPLRLSVYQAATVATENLRRDGSGRNP